MIPALIVYLIRKYYRRKGNGPASIKTNNLFRVLRSKAATSWLLLLVCVPTLAQNQSLFYQVMYHGSRVGEMKMVQQKTGEDLRIDVSSTTSMKMLLSINVDAREASCFKNGRLVYSSVIRKVNGKEKANRQTEYNGNEYLLKTDGNENTRSFQPIEYNVHLLLYNEPHDLQPVYSDNFQEFLKVEKIADHKYRLMLPDGNYNIYYFNGGICERIEINHTLYTVNLILDKTFTVSN